MEQLFAALGQYGAVRLQEAATAGDAGQHDLPISALPNLQLNHSKEQPLLALDQFLQSFAGRTLFAVESEGRREVLGDLLARISLQPKEFPSLDAFMASQDRHGLLVAPLERGFLLQEAGQDPLALITETELLGGKVRSKRAREKSKNLSSDAVIRNLGELTQGQPVVHLDHGSAAIWGWRPSTPVACPPSSSPSNMPAATSCSCRSPACTSSAATPVPITPQPQAGW